MILCQYEIAFISLLCGAVCGRCGTKDQVADMSLWSASSIAAVLWRASLSSISCLSGCPWGKEKESAFKQFGRCFYVRASAMPAQSHSKSEALFFSSIFCEVVPSKIALEVCARVWAINAI
jgi:hypothetical protein